MVLRRAGVAKRSRGLLVGARVATDSTTGAPSPAPPRHPLEAAAAVSCGDIPTSSVWGQRNADELEVSLGGAAAVCVSPRAEAPKAPQAEEAAVGTSSSAFVSSEVIHRPPPKDLLATRACLRDCGADASLPHLLDLSGFLELLLEADSGSDEPPEDDPAELFASPRGRPLQCGKGRGRGKGKALGPSWGAAAAASHYYEAAGSSRSPDASRPSKRNRLPFKQRRAMSEMPRGRETRDLGERCRYYFADNSPKAAGSVDGRAAAQRSSSRPRCGDATESDLWLGKARGNDKSLVKQLRGMRGGCQIGTLHPCGTCASGKQSGTQGACGNGAGGKESISGRGRRCKEGMIALGVRRASESAFARRRYYFDCSDSDTPPGAVMVDEDFSQQGATLLFIGLGLQHCQQFFWSTATTFARQLAADFHVELRLPDVYVPSVPSPEQALPLPDADTGTAGSHGRASLVLEEEYKLPRVLHMTTWYLGGEPASSLPAEARNALSLEGSTWPLRPTHLLYAHGAMLVAALEVTRSGLPLEPGCWPHATLLTRLPFLPSNARELLDKASADGLFDASRVSGGSSASQPILALPRVRLAGNWVDLYVQPWPWPDGIATQLEARLQRF